MRKLRRHNNLRGFPARPTARPAFSLAELVISMGILVLLMSLAGQVFNFTVESTGQATALTRINQTLRMMERAIREDLAQLQAGHSVMIIQGNPVNAYWTADGQEADNDGNPATGYDMPPDPDRERFDANGKTIPTLPRADILMFVTARTGKSFVSPTVDSQPVTSQVQLVTYGMAELGDYTYDAAASTPTNPVYKFDFPYGEDAADNPNFPVIPVDSVNYPDPKTPSRFPASQWHLFRRPTLLFPTDPAISPISMMPSTMDANDFENLILGALDVMGGVSLEEDVLRPDVLPFLANDSARMAPWYLPRFLVGSFQRLADIRGREHLPLYAPSKLDPLPPPLLASRMGHYLLPNCASFKVEWTLDPQSEFVGGRLDGINDTLWFDPGDDGDPLRPNSGPDPLRSAQNMIDRLAARIGAEASAGAREFLKTRKVNLESLVKDRWDDGSMEGFCDQDGYSLQDRFRGRNDSHTGPESECGWPQLSADRNRPNLAVFTATRPKLFQDQQTKQVQWDGVQVVPDPMFPGALRITIDLYDDNGRLQRPIRHVMIIRLGG